jgi:hypothetical protein
MNSIIKNVKEVFQILEVHGLDTNKLMKEIDEIVVCQLLQELDLCMKHQK